MTRLRILVGGFAAGALLTLALTMTGVPAAQAATTQDADSEAAGMLAWMKAMNPGPAQASLASMAGTWKTTWTHRASPDMPASSGSGSTRFEMVLGGRYLREELTGTSMGLPFLGLGYTAYDNAMGEWANVWMDNFGTGLTITRGRGEPDGPMPELRGTYSDPRFEAAVPIRIVHDEVGADRMRMTMFTTQPGQDEYESMTIEYVREGRGG